MKTLRAVFVVLILALAVPSVAKGPVSATLTTPEGHEPIQFLDTPMLRWSGLWYGPMTDIVQAPPERLGSPHILTWVTMSPSSDSLDKQTTVLEESTILQYIYLDASGGPLIHTPDQPGLDGWGDGVIGWFDAPEELTGLIDEIVGSTPVADPSPQWILPALAALIVAALVLLGSSYGAQASTRSANASTVGAAGIARITDSSTTASSN